MLLLMTECCCGRSWSTAVSAVSRSISTVCRCPHGRKCRPTSQTGAVNAADIAKSAVSSTTTALCVSLSSDMSCFFFIPFLSCDTGIVVGAVDG